MRVISGPTEWSTEKTCKECKAVLEIGIKDVLIGEFDGGYCESGDKWIYANCPVCGDPVRISKYWETPKFVRLMADENRK